MREAIQAQDPAAQVDGFPAEKRLEVTSSLTIKRWIVPTMRVTQRRRERRTTPRRT